MPVHRLSINVAAFVGRESTRDCRSVTAQSKELLELRPPKADLTSSTASFEPPATFMINDTESLTASG
jgi:hypothetical protein